MYMYYIIKKDFSQVENRLKIGRIIIGLADDELEEVGREVYGGALDITAKIELHL